MAKSIEIYEDYDQHGRYILQAKDKVFYTLAEVEDAFPDAEIVIHHNLKPVPRNRDTAGA